MFCLMALETFNGFAQNDAQKEYPVFTAFTFPRIFALC